MTMLDDGEGVDDEMCYRTDNAQGIIFLLAFLATPFWRTELDHNAYSI